MSEATICNHCVLENLKDRLSEVEVRLVSEGPWRGWHEVIANGKHYGYFERISAECAC